MRAGRWSLWLASLACLQLAGVAGADTVWNEPVAGDLSNNGLVPTSLAFTLGGNEIHGTVGNGGAGVDRDYFNFIVPVGMAIDSLMLLPDTGVSGGSSFIAIQRGPQVTPSPEGAGAEALLAFSHYGNDQVGLDLFTLLGLPNGLASGQYSVWVNETGGPASYGLDFEVSAVPLPAAAWLLLSGLAGLATSRRCLRRPVSSD